MAILPPGGAVWVSSDGPGGWVGCGVIILLNPGSNETLEMRSVAMSVESPLLLDRSSVPSEDTAIDPVDPSLATEFEP